MGRITKQFSQTALAMLLYAAKLEARGPNGLGSASGDPAHKRPISVNHNLNLKPLQQTDTKQPGAADFWAENCKKLNWQTKGFSMRGSRAWPCLQRTTAHWMGTRWKVARKGGISQLYQWRIQFQSICQLKLMTESQQRRVKVLTKSIRGDGPSAPLLRMCVKARCRPDEWTSVSGLIFLIFQLEK